MSEQLTLAIHPEEVTKAALELEGKHPTDILEWGMQQFYPDIALACSFGAEDVALLDMIVKIQPNAKIFYLDTDVLFQETYELRDKLIDRYHPNLIQYRPLLTLEEQAERHGEALWASTPTDCCNIRKVEPLERALKPLDAWVTGIRRDQAPTRANTKMVEADARFGLIKLNPLAAWTSDDVWNYIKEHDVPYNVLHEQGYPSIGCVHCTRAVAPGEDPRAGRWANFAKTECGLHFKQ